MLDGGLLARPVRVKQLVLVIGAVYFTLLAVTNVVSFVVSAGGYHWAFLNSGNVSYIASVTKVYNWPAWFDKAAVLAAAVVEAAGAFLFANALRFVAAAPASVRRGSLSAGTSWSGSASSSARSSSWPTRPKARSGSCWPSPC